MQIKRVADFWCSGDCERARALPRSLYNEILALVIAQEQGRAIEAEADAKDAEQKAKLARMRNP